MLETVFTNVPELSTVNFADFPLLPTSKSDKCHVPIMCNLECTPNLLSSNDGGTALSFHKANYDDIREYLRNIDFTGIIENSFDVNESVASIYNNLHETIEKFVPKSSIR